MTANRNPLGLLLLAGAGLILAACSGDDDGEPPAPARRILDITAGLDLGQRKTFVRAYVEEGGTSYCNAAGRHFREGVALDEFRSYVRPEHLAYRGHIRLQAEGNDWDEFRWEEPGGKSVVVCHPVRALGEEIAAFFARTTDFEATKLPFAIVRIEQGDTVIRLPMRDLSGHEAPQRALLAGAIPAERSALADQTGYLIETKLLSGDATEIATGLAELKTAPDEVVVALRDAVMKLRRHPEPRVADPAAAFCRERDWFNGQDIVDAIRAVRSDDRAAVLGGLADLERYADHDEARRFAPQALRHLLGRDDLDDEVRQRGRAVLAIYEAR